ncbi:MAG: ATP-binding protein, partial [Calditrichia bacterium]
HIEVDDHLRIQEEQIPQPIKLVIFRIIQEALNNMAKHSKANLVSVSLKQEDGHISLEIEDDGVGFNKEKTLSRKSFTGLGLASMKERTEFSGGEFEIISHVGEGTILKARWPFSTG